MLSRKSAAKIPMGNAAVTHSCKPGIHLLFVLLRKVEVEACKSITS